MKNIALFIVLISAFACAKYTTPGKVNRKLTSGVWRMSEFIDNDTSIMKKYMDVTLTFGEDGSVASTSAGKAHGTWKVGADRNPAIIYIDFPTELDSMHVLTDDWVVYKLNKRECILKRNKGTDFNYDESFDMLSLLKQQ